MEWFKSIIDSISGFLKNDIDFLKLGVYSPATYIAVAGIALIFVAFLIALIAKSASKNKKFTKRINKTTAFINSVGTFDEENVEQLNGKLQSLHPVVSKGWGNFLDRQTGYPSDYIAEYEVIGKGKAFKKAGAGRAFFRVFSLLVVLVGIALAAISCKDMFSANAKDITLIVLAIGGAVCGPLIVYVILSAILSGAFGRQFKKLRQSFHSFQDALDNSVMLYRDEMDEFVSENIEEINATIEEIIANKLDDKGIIEIITTPKVSEEHIIYEENELSNAIFVEEKEEVKEEEPVSPAPAVVEEEVVAAVPVKTAEEIRGERLVQLVFIADRASKDDNITMEELVELADLLQNAKDSGEYDSPDEQSIFDDCLKIIAARYYR